MTNTQTGAGFTIIIAAYNEAAVIAKTIARAHQVWPDAQIIVVDDGSTDDTCEVVNKIKAPFLRLHSYQPNRGKGFAIARGIELVETPFSLQLDADCQFPPEAMPALAAPLIEGHARLVFCSRYCAGGSIEPGSVSGSKRLASKTASRLVSVLVGQTLTDVFAGFKAWETALSKASQYPNRVLATKRNWRSRRRSREKPSPRSPLLMRRARAGNRRSGFPGI